jgi:O6-methylguanine-DNA--protein-cysteine methyltransferase
MARTAKVPAITPAQAHFVLERLIDEGKVSAADVRGALGEMWTEMNAIQRRIAELRAVAEPIRHPGRAVQHVRKAARKTFKRAVSAERKASQQLQGQYLGFMRQIRKTARAKYKRIANDFGREKAVAAMRKALGK